MRLSIILAVIVSMLSMPVLADQEASNRPIVRSSSYGIIYAKSIPDEDYGQEGTTLVYSVGFDEDVLIAEYDWYSSEIYIGGSGDAKSLCIPKAPVSSLKIATSHINSSTIGIPCACKASLYPSFRKAPPRVGNPIIPTRT